MNNESDEDNKVNVRELVVTIIACVGSWIAYFNFEGIPKYVALTAGVVGLLNLFVVFFFRVLIKNEKSLSIWADNFLQDKNSFLRLRKLLLLIVSILLTSLLIAQTYLFYLVYNGRLEDSLQEILVGLALASLSIALTSVIGYFLAAKPFKNILLTGISGFVILLIVSLFID